MGMTFDEVLAQVLELLQHEGRVSYRALKRRFALDDEYLEDLKAEIIDAKHLAADEDGKVLVWTSKGSLESSVQNPHSTFHNSQSEAEAEACFHKAIEIARQQQAKSLELRAVTSLSRLWQQQDKKDEARQ